MAQTKGSYFKYLPLKKPSSGRMLKHVIRKQMEMRGEAAQAHLLVLQMIYQFGTSSINYVNLLCNVLNELLNN